jgi:hypothetical protein
MLARAAVFTLALLCAGAPAALASDRGAASPAPLADAVARAAKHAGADPINLWTLSQEPKRPRMLPVLYGTYATLHALDIVTTRRAIKAGAREVNPLMNSGHVGTMIAVKAATGVSTMYITEKMWKKNRAAAVILMAAINGATAAVVSHNFTTARNVRR